ncbi:MAG TPA: GGDEF domain-containing protein [Patescibacteria group bacterium]|nr:GGDEF domain-containing protein [Patescibacteria group bacterium]
MMDPLDKTICDRKLLPPVNGTQKAEHSIMLTIIGGNETDFGKHFILEKKQTILGRDKTVDITILDGKISKVHCEISVIRRGSVIEQIGIRDLDSTNGTYVNGESVSQVTLKAGDKIQAGDTVLQLSYSDEIEKEYHAKLFNFAARDALTGLYNKRFMLNELENYSRITRRSGRAFSIIMIDIDDFKQINDRFGHLSGDEYLKHLAELVIHSLRDQDIAGRIGGEEFLIILPETAIDGAFQLAVRIRKNIEQFVLRYQNSEIRTTISAGVCQFDKSLKDVKEFLDLADQAMYEAKKSEKNKVMQALFSTMAEK